MVNKKDVKNLLNEIEGWPGWRLERRTKGWFAYPPDTSKSPVAIHETYSDPRSFKNTVAQLRRAGAPL